MACRARPRSPSARTARPSAPGALEDLGQQQHRHVAAHARRIARRSPPARRPAPPAAPDWRSRAAACPPSRENWDRDRAPGCASPGRCRRGSSCPARPPGPASLPCDIEIRDASATQGWSRAVWLRHEIEHQPHAARGEPGAEIGQRRRAAQRRVDLVGGDGEARSGDVVFASGRASAAWNSARQAGSLRDTARLAGPVAIRPAARSSRSRGGRGRPASHRRHRPG